MILKTNADGDFIWGTRIGNSSYDHDIEAMELENAESLLVAGWYRGNFEIGGIVPDNGSVGQYGHYLARFDSSNALLDIHTSRFTYARGVRGVGIDEGGNIYIAGFFQDSLSFPGLPVMDLANASNGAMFVARSGDFNTGVDAESEANDGVSIYPMPSSGRFTIRSEQPLTELRITNALGELVLREIFPTSTLRSVELPGSGVYFYTLFSNGERLTSGRVIVER